MTTVLVQRKSTVKTLLRRDTTKLLTVARRGGQGIQGEAGQDGADGIQSYTHEQTMPDIVWIIPHNLGRRVNVTVFDSFGNECEGCVMYVTDNLIQITFSAAFSGTAYLV